MRNQPSNDALRPCPSSTIWEEVPIGPRWFAELRNFGRSAFRLEVLQEYGEPSESHALALFMQGNPVGREYIADWCDMVAEQTSRGRSMSRVHVVSLPLSAYLRFEVECAYTHTAAAGEDIRLLNIATVPLFLKDYLKEDFWLFDDSRVMVQDYDSRGQLVLARICSDPEVVAHYSAIRHRAVKLSEAFQPFYLREVGKSL